MEHVVDSFLTRTFSVATPDPYKVSHDMLHWCQQFGRVEEHINRVLSSGPRTVSEVEFTLKKAIDRFSAVVVRIRLDGHTNLSRLDISVDASFRADIPAPIGLVTKVFEDYYATKLFPHLFGTAKRAAGDIVEALEKRVSAVHLKALK